MIAGVDLGKNKASVAIFDGQRLVHVNHLELDAHLRRANNLHELATWVYYQVQSVAVLYIEEPLVGRNTRQSLEIAQTAGAVMSACYGKHQHLVPVSMWKATTVGKGNATKQEIKDWLTKRYPEYEARCLGNQDRVDAVCIGLYGANVERYAQQFLEEF